MLSFVPRGVLDEIFNLIESVSEVFSSYSCIFSFYCLCDSSYPKSASTISKVPSYSRQQAVASVSYKHISSSYKVVCAYHKFIRQTFILWDIVNVQIYIHKLELYQLIRFNFNCPNTVQIEIIEAITIIIRSRYPTRTITKCIPAVFVLD